MTKDTVYKYLIKTFGGVQYSGVRYLAYLVCNLGEKDRLREHYNKLAEEYNSTPAAVERAIRNYVATWSDKATAEELAIMFNYTLAPDQDKLYVREVIPLLRRYMDNME